VPQGDTSADTEYKRVVGVSDGDQLVGRSLGASSKTVIQGSIRPPFDQFAA
jgi:hypothetical protein